MLDFLQNAAKIKKHNLKKKFVKYYENKQQ